MVLCLQYCCLLINDILHPEVCIDLIPMFPNVINYTGNSNSMIHVNKLCQNFHNYITPNNSKIIQFTEQRAEIC